MKLNRKKAVIFDLDGTLVDSMWMWKAIDIEYLARFGLACPDDLQKEIEGMSFSETAVYFKERFRLKESLDEIKNAWIQMFHREVQKGSNLEAGSAGFPGIYLRKGTGGRHCHQQRKGHGGCGAGFTGYPQVLQGGGNSL